MIVPRNNHIDLLLKYLTSGFERAKELHDVIIQYRDLCVSQPSNTVARSDLNRLCELVIRQNQKVVASASYQGLRGPNGSPEYAPEAVGLVIHVCLALGMPNMVEKGVTAVAKPLSKQSMSNIVPQFSKFSFEQLRGW